MSYDEFKKATEAELVPMRVHEGTLGECLPLYFQAILSSCVSEGGSSGFYLAFMFETSMQVTITDYGMKRTGKLHGAYPDDPDTVYSGVRCGVY